MKIKKLLPLLGLSVALVGCGQATDDNTSSDATETTTVEAPASEEESTDVNMDSEDEVQTENDDTMESTEDIIESTEVEDSNNN